MAESKAKDITEKNEDEVKEMKDNKEDKEEIGIVALEFFRNWAN